MVSHVQATRRKKAQCIYIACAHLPSLPPPPTPSLYLCVCMVPPPPHTPTHIHPCLSFHLSSLFSCICIYLLVCLTVSLSCCSIQTALLIQGQSMFSLGWCQTLERGVFWKFNLDSSPNHIAVMLSIWPPVCPLNIRSLTLSITCPFDFWSKNLHFLSWKLSLESYEK